MTLFTTKNLKISHIKNDREDNPSLFWLLYKKFFCLTENLKSTHLFFSLKSFLSMKEKHIICFKKNLACLPNPLKDVSLLNEKDCIKYGGA
ncbi:hypothetical protein DB42_AC00520 [Neochlamydia sp. EPS4]|nr:hypothetical protein DB42_AC00520 [Neochlamydia sp. EPS4]